VTAGRKAINTLFVRQCRLEELFIEIGSMYVYVTSPARPVGPPVLVITVVGVTGGCDVALGTQSVIRRIERLRQHAGKIGTVRRVTVEAAAFFRRVFNSCLMLVGKRPLKFVVAAETHSARLFVGQASRDSAQVRMAFAAGHDAVLHRVTVRIGEFPPHPGVASVAEFELGVFEQREMMVVVDLVTGQAADVVFRVNVSFTQVLLVIRVMAGSADFRGRFNRYPGWIRDVGNIRIIDMYFSAAVAVRAHDGICVVRSLQLVNAAFERLIIAIVAVQTLIAEVAFSVGRKTAKRQEE